MMKTMMNSTNIRSYEELIKIENFQDRINYLMLFGTVSYQTFGGRRAINQMLYHFTEWKKRVRREVILRDNGYDLAHPDHPIIGNIYIHHINPITEEDIIKKRDCVFDLNNLISCSFDVHNLIHYGNREIKEREIISERRPGDTKLW